VTENLPAGYVPAGALTKVASVTTAGTCASATPVAFQNLPLTDITVTVHSQVDGGTASTISCTGLPDVNTNASGNASASLANLVAGTYTCTVVVH